MTTEITLFQNNAVVPAHIAARMGQLSTTTQGLVAGMTGESIPRLKLEQGRWRIREGGDEQMLDTLYADIIVVGAISSQSKTFYAKAFVPGQEPAAPDCSSVLGDKPDVSSTSPQSAACATCPQNQWGSKLTPQGVEIKACSDTHRIAVVSADDPTGTVYLCAVPAASLKNFKKYVKTLAMRGVDISMVVTRLTAGVANFPLYEFNASNFCTNEQLAAVDAIDQGHVQEILGVLGRQAASLPAPQVAPTPAPQVAPTPAPQAEAPKRGFGKKATTAPAPAPAPQAASAPAPQAAPQVAATDMTELEAQIAALSSL